jgi:hypothetical protein
MGGGHIYWRMTGNSHAHSSSFDPDFSIA